MGTTTVGLSSIIKSGLPEPIDERLHNWFKEVILEKPCTFVWVDFVINSVQISY